MEKNKIKSFWNEKWVLVKTKYPTATCNYMVSNHGRIKSVVKTTGTEKLIKGSTDNRGFTVVNIRLAGDKRGHFYPHKVIAEHFIPKPKGDGYEYIIHLDRDKKNNNWRNMKWVTQRQLFDDQKERGVGIYSKEKHQNAKHVKMTETKVALLKKRIKEGKTKWKVLAKSFGITETQLRRIERGENWGYVKPLD
jgi:hypothetical protein